MYLHRMRTGESLYLEVEGQRMRVLLVSAPRHDQALIGLEVPPGCRVWAGPEAEAFEKRQAKTQS